jgi:hypothetical protein
MWASFQSHRSRVSRNWHSRDRESSRQTTVCVHSNDSKQNFSDWDTMGIPEASKVVLRLGNARRWTSTPLSLQIAYNAEALFTFLYTDKCLSPHVFATASGRGSVAVGLGTVFDRLTVCSGNAFDTPHLIHNMRKLFESKVTVCETPFLTKTMKNSLWNIMVLEPGWDKAGLESLPQEILLHFSHKIEDDTREQILVCIIPRKCDLEYMSELLMQNGLTTLVLECRKHPPRNIKDEALTRLKPDEYFNIASNERYNGPVKVLYVCRQMDFATACQLATEKTEIHTGCDTVDGHTCTHLVSYGSKDLALYTPRSGSDSDIVLRSL